MHEAGCEVAIDRRGRILAHGEAVVFESEIDTFKALAKKYLRRELRQIVLLTDPPQVAFDVK